MGVMWQNNVQIFQRNSHNLTLNHGSSLRRTERHNPLFELLPQPAQNICITFVQMSAQRLRRWSDIVQMLYKCFVLAAFIERVGYYGLSVQRMIRSLTSPLDPDVVNDRRFAFDLEKIPLSIILIMRYICELNLVSGSGYVACPCIKIKVSVNPIIVTLNLLF